MSHLNSNVVAVGKVAVVCSTMMKVTPICGDHIGKPTVKLILSWVSVPLLIQFPANGECACAMYCTIWPHMCKNVK